MREEAEKRGPHVIYVDAYSMFSDENGEYADRLDVPVGPESPGETKSVRVRVGDGVHLTPAGADFLATPVFSLLDSRYRLTAQADAAHPINYTLGEGRRAVGFEPQRHPQRHGTGSGTRSGTGSGTGTQEVDRDDRAEGREHADDADAPPRRHATRRSPHRTRRRPRPIRRRQPPAHRRSRRCESDAGR